MLSNIRSKTHRNQYETKEIDKIQSTKTKTIIYPPAQKKKRKTTTPVNFVSILEQAMLQYKYVCTPQTIKSR